jgi:hypothetical protein
MATLDLKYVNELIDARHVQHGGGVGAPPKIEGYRIGTALNRSCIVMLSALLQSYVEEVFQAAARRRFPALDDDAFAAYWKQMKGWGNPSEVNIKNLFIQIGVPDVFTGLSWQKTPTATVRTRLGHLNLIRNQIAHGSKQLKVDGQSYSLSLAKVEAFRNFAQQFGERFEAHVGGLVP